MNDCCLMWEMTTKKHNTFCGKHVPPWMTETTSDVIFSLSDGSELIIEDVNFDSIGPTGANKDVICVERRDNDDLIHVPFVRSWTIRHNV